MKHASSVLKYVKGRRHYWKWQSKPIPILHNGTPQLRVLFVPLTIVIHTEGLI